MSGYFKTMADVEFGTLCDAVTGEVIRDATEAELDGDHAAHASDLRGIDVNGRRCIVADVREPYWAMTDGGWVPAVGWPRED